MLLRAATLRGALVGQPCNRWEASLARVIEPPYVVAVKKLLAEGYALNARTCFYERGDERLKLRWNGRVYARRRGPPLPGLGPHALAETASFANVDAEEPALPRESGDPGFLRLSGV